MYILGINAYHGDSSSCLIKDGVVVCAIEEERLRRVKHWAGFPSKAIKFCLKDQNISINEIDYITISRDTNANFLKKILYFLQHSIDLSLIFDRLLNFRKINSIKKQLAQTLEVSLSSINAKFYNIEHHRSHISSAFFASSFHESAILSIDGFGDFTSTMTAVGVGNKFKVLNKLNYPHSLGIFYTAATQFLGFHEYGDEYKVMGLAPYGKPIFIKHFEDIIKVNSDGFFSLNKKYFKHFDNGVKMDWLGGKPSIESLFTSKWIELFGKPRLEKDKIEQHHIDFASTVQRITEDIIFHILNHLYDNTRCKNICISGGVAQNSVVNGKILNNTKFENIYIPSAGHDAGTSIGSSLYLYNQILGEKRMPEITSAYFGSRFTTKEITSILDEKKVKYNIFSDEDMFEIVVDKLISGGVVGWFQGRSEFGPRSLGNRSILVDPRRKDAKNLLNKKIKRREHFRPFAPSILKDFVSDYFVQDRDVPFMEQVFDFKKEKYNEIPAVVHVDGTGRLQTVDISTSPKYFNLISSFYKRTGVPILLNTSFNENEPIVDSPFEALDCFLRTKMDMLVMENVIIER
jgi:carbamoyltransferase